MKAETADLRYSEVWENPGNWMKSFFFSKSVAVDALFGILQNFQNRDVLRNLSISL